MTCCFNCSHYLLVDGLVSFLLKIAAEYKSRTTWDRIIPMNLSGILYLLCVYRCLRNYFGVRHVFH